MPPSAPPAHSGHPPRQGGRQGGLGLHLGLPAVLRPHPGDLPTVLAGLRTNPEYTLTPLPGVGEEAYLVKRKDGFRPEVYFVSSGHLYSVEVVKDRSPDDEVNAPAEAAAASGLALALSKLV